MSRDQFKAATVTVADVEAGFCHLTTRTKTGKPIQVTLTAVPARKFIEISSKPGVLAIDVAFSVLDASIEEPSILDKLPPREVMRLGDVAMYLAVGLGDPEKNEVTETAAEPPRAQEPQVSGCTSGAPSCP